MTWRKANYGANGGGCIEVAPAPAAVAVRDSKDPGGPQICFAAENWRVFTRQIKQGRLSL